MPILTGMGSIIAIKDIRLENIPGGQQILIGLHAGPGSSGQHGTAQDGGRSPWIDAIPARSSAICMPPAR
jgi:hypothetical protein